MPLLVLAGGAALLLSGKKKKKKAKAAEPEPYEPSTDEPEPYDVPIPTPKPAPSPTRPAGNPPGGDRYDPAYWGSTTDERLESIRRHFVELGYQVEVGAWPMNIVGPKGKDVMPVMENTDGTMGKPGGGDDTANPTVKEFQHNYNMVSRLNRAEKIYSVNMGGLGEDGYVGPYTLNGLRTAVEGLPGGKLWSDLILQATNKGIS